VTKVHFKIFLFFIGILNDIYNDLIQNRIRGVFERLDFDNYPVINDDQLRIHLKKSLNF